MRNENWIGCLIIGGVMTCVILAPLYAIHHHFQKEPEDEVSEDTTLPISTRRWLEAGIDTGKHNKTWVLELEHGWLVYRETYMGSAMVFVPRQEKTADQGKPDPD